MHTQKSNRTVFIGSSHFFVHFFLRQIRPDICSDSTQNISFFVEEKRMMATIRVLNTYVISKFYRIPYLSHLRLIFLSNFEIYLLYGDVWC